MVVNSFTQMGKEYEVTLDKNGQAIDCQCGDHIYRHHECKHMSNATWQVKAEIEKATTFLSLFNEYDVRAIAERKAQEERETAASYARMFYYGI